MKKIIAIVLYFIIISPAFSQTFEQKFIEYNLVNIKTIDSTIVVDLPYSTTKNFTGTNLYGNLQEAYTTLEFATMLVLVQKELKSINKNLSIIVLDAARPISVQRFMYEMVKGTDWQNYVANPDKGGRHNYAMALDVSIVNEKGELLDMGSSFDHFGPTSHIGNEDKLVKDGLMTQQAKENRELLVKLMVKYGFEQISNEWWHFQKYTLNQVKEKYKLLDF